MNSELQTIKYYAGFNQKKIEAEVSEAFRLGSEALQNEEQLKQVLLDKENFIALTFGNICIMKKVMEEQIKAESGEKSSQVPFESKLAAYKYFDGMLDLIMNSFKKKE